MKPTISNGISAIPKTTEQGPVPVQVPLAVKPKARRIIEKGLGRFFNTDAPLFVPREEFAATQPEPSVAKGHSSLVYYLELLNLPSNATKSGLEDLVKQLCFEITKNHITCFEVVNFDTLEVPGASDWRIGKIWGHAEFEEQVAPANDLRIFATVGVTRWDVFSSLLWALDGYEWDNQIINARVGAPRDGSMDGNGVPSKDFPQLDQFASSAFPTSRSRLAYEAIGEKELEFSKLSLFVNDPRNAYGSSSGCVMSPFDMHYSLLMGMSPPYFGCNAGFHGIYPGGFHVGAAQSKRQNHTKDTRSTSAPRRLNGPPSKGSEQTPTSSEEPGKRAPAGEQEESRENYFIEVESEDGMGSIKVDPCRLFVGNVPFKLTWIGLRSFFVSQSAKKDPNANISIEKVKIPMQQLVYNCFGQMIGNSFDPFTRDMYLRHVRPGWDADSLQTVLALTPLYNLSKSKGYAIVQTGDAELAKKLIEMFDDVEFEGRSLTVRYDRFPLIDSYVLQQVSTGSRRLLSARWKSDAKEIKRVAESIKNGKWGPDAKEGKRAIDSSVNDNWGSYAKEGKGAIDSSVNDNWESDAKEGKGAIGSSVNDNWVSDAKKGKGAIDSSVSDNWGSDAKKNKEPAGLAKNQKWETDAKDGKRPGDTKNLEWGSDFEQDKWATESKDGRWGIAVPESKRSADITEDGRWGADTIKDGRWGADDKISTRGAGDREGSWGINLGNSKWRADIKVEECQVDKKEKAGGSDSIDQRWDDSFTDAHDWGSSMVQVEGLYDKYEDSRQERSLGCSEISKFGTRLLDKNVQGTIANSMVEANNSVKALDDVSANKMPTTRKAVLTGEWTLVEKKVRDRGLK